MESREMMMPDPAKRAKEHWDTTDLEASRYVSWYNIEYIGKRRVKELLGRSDMDTYISTLLEPRGAVGPLRGAAIACGDMESEKGCFENPQMDMFNRVDGFDLSEISMKRYVPKNIEFAPHVIDCNDLVLEKDTYDLIAGTHGLHHIYNLGGAFFQINKALKTHGLLSVHEWIGPNFLQIPRTNHVLASLLLLTLFSKKTRTNHMGRVKGLWVQEQPAMFDPSEACNSRELLPQFRKYFVSLTEVRFGGLCYPVFEGITQNLDQNKWSTKLKIKFVYWLERILTRIGIIKPLFLQAVARKRNIWSSD